MILSKVCATRSIASSLDAHFPIYPFGVCNNTLSTSPPERWRISRLSRLYIITHLVNIEHRIVPRLFLPNILDIEAYTRGVGSWWMFHMNSYTDMSENHIPCRRCYLHKLSVQKRSGVQSTHASSPLLGPNVWTGHRMHFLCPCLVDVNPEHAEYRKLFRTRILFHRINGKEKITPCFCSCWVFMMLKYTWILKSQKETLKWRNWNSFLRINVPIITSFCGHLMYIETLWKVMNWSIKWPYSTQWDQIEIFRPRHTFLFVTMYGLMWSSSVKLLT